MRKSLPIWILVNLVPLVAAQDHIDHMHMVSAHSGPNVYAQHQTIEENCVPCDGFGDPIFDSTTRSIYGGADFLYIRPHFSEAVAFARGSQTLASFDINAQPIEFDYEGGLRAFLAISAGQKDSIRVSYTDIDGDVSVNGTLGAGEFIVDPFGNVVGTVTIIDPSDARVGTSVIGGDAIQTSSSVETKVFDIDFTREWDDCLGWSLRLDAGARIAEVDQTYDSLVTTAGNPLAAGTFSAAFQGAGPHFGLEGKRFLDNGGCFLLTAAAHGALLLGDFDVSSGNTLGGGAFTASQSESQRRIIPVIEFEVGAHCRITKSMDVSAGWLFHAWNDLGVSGGTFGGLFSGADDANNMSFDGLFVRAEFRR